MLSIPIYMFVWATVLNAHIYKNKKYEQFWFVKTNVVSASWKKSYLIKLHIPNRNVC